MKKILLVSALLLSITAVEASESPQWDEASLSFQHVRVSNVDFNGFSFGANKLINDNVFLSAGVSKHQLAILLK